MNIAEAITQLKTTTKSSKFDQTVELHINLGTDPAKQEHNVRVTLTLPHGTGKEKRVLLISDSVGAKRASPAIADREGGDAVIEDIATGKLKPKIDFDAVVATPDMMPKLAKIARILGPASMMPNPKTGTVTGDTEKAIAEIKKGQIELKTEKGASNIHTIIGKLSFSDEALAANYKAIIDALNVAKPAKIKGKFIKTVTLKSTQSKGISVEI